MFSQRDTKVMLKEVFDSSTSYFSHAKFLKELIIKEVKFLDSQSISYKAEYFEKYFSVSFGKEQEINELKEIMD